MGFLSLGRWYSWASTSTGKRQEEPGVGHLWVSAHSIITSLVLQWPLSISASQGLRAALFGGLAFLVCLCRPAGPPIGIRSTLPTHLLWAHLIFIIQPGASL